MYQEYYKRIQEYLTNLKTDVTFDELLEEIRLTENDYIIAVQTSLKAEKVFLERRPIESRINPYMKGLLDVWKANHEVCVGRLCLRNVHSVVYQQKYKRNESVDG